MKRDYRFLIKVLNLKKHPEGGYYKEVFRTNEKISKQSLPKRYNGDRNLYTSIYFLLEGENISSFHKLKTDEIWHFYYGSRIIIYIIENKNLIKKIKLGHNVKSGDNFQVIIKKGHWFAAEVEDKKSYSLAGCTMAPGFEFEDFEMGSKKSLIKTYPKHKEIIERLTSVD